MININELFLKRISFEWKSNISNFKMVIDWTIALYLIVPFVVLGAEQYLKLWDSSAKVLDGIPLRLFISISAFFAWTGTTRLFIKEADQLFLWSKDNWIKNMIIRGILYTVGVSFISSLLLFSLFAPVFIVQYKMSLLSFINLFLLTLMSKVVLSLLKHQLELSFEGFRKEVVLRGAFLVFNILFVITAPLLIVSLKVHLLISFALLVLILYLSNKRIKVRGSFFIDVERERNEELKYVRVLLAMAGVSVPKEKSKRTRPLIYRHSNLLFKNRSARNGLVELCIKATLRNKTNVTNYLMIMILCILIVITFPFFDGLIWLGLSFIFTSFVSLFWMTPMSSNLVKMFKWKEEDIYYASQKFIFIMTLPGFMIISFFASSFQF